MFTLSANPFTGQLSRASLYLSENIRSRVSANMSSIMRGISILRTALLSSMEGLVLTSISQSLQASSIMKSYPKSSKQSLRPLTLIFLRTAHMDSHTISRILLWILEQTASMGICSLRSVSVIWLPEDSSYSLQCFCTELLVRWMKGFLWLSVEYFCEENRRQPSRKKYTSQFWVSRAQTRMSNLRQLTSRGHQMYFWTTKLSTRSPPGLVSSTLGYGLVSILVSDLIQVFSVLWGVLSSSFSLNSLNCLSSSSSVMILMMASLFYWLSDSLKRSPMPCLSSQSSRSCPWQYFQISFQNQERLLKRETPRPRFMKVGFNIQRQALDLLKKVLGQLGLQQKLPCERLCSCCADRQGVYLLRGSSMECTFWPTQPSGMLRLQNFTNPCSARSSSPVVRSMMKVVGRYTKALSLFISQKLTMFQTSRCLLVSSRWNSKWLKLRHSLPSCWYLNPKEFCVHLKKMPQWLVLSTSPLRWERAWRMASWLLPLPRQQQRLLSPHYLMGCIRVPVERQLLGLSGQRARLLDQRAGCPNCQACVVFGVLERGMESALVSLRLWDCSFVNIPIYLVDITSVGCLLLQGADSALQAKTVALGCCAQSVNGRWIRGDITIQLVRCLSWVRSIIYILGMEEAEVDVPVIGHYTLGRTIGRGGYAKVREGLHTLTGQRVAVKIINKARMKNKKMISKVKRQIKILKFIKHPNIIKLYEVLDTPTDIFVVMEMAAGGQLFQYINKHEFTENEARFFFMQIIEGVQFAHFNLVSHRDLKPENVLLDSNKNVKIADFGLSNLMKDGKLLRTNCGSLNYAAPQIIGRREYEGTSIDVWSCGVILFTMLCGELPFDEEIVSILYKKIERAEYTVPQKVSPLARDLIDRMLQVHPCRRIRVQQIRTHPWLRKVLPIYAKVSTFCSIIKEREFQLDNDILAQVRSYGMSSLKDVRDQERISKVIKRRMDDSFVTAYELLKDEKERTNQLLGEMEDREDVGADLPLFQALENRLKPGMKSLQSDYLFGCTFPKTARMVIEEVLVVLNAMQIRYKIKKTEYLVVCSYNVPRLRLQSRINGNTEQRTYGSQDEQRFSKREIKFSLQLYSKPAQNMDIMVDLRLTQGHPLVFASLARRLYDRVYAVFRS